jgi:hypothetical protein
MQSRHFAVKPILIKFCILRLRTDMRLSGSPIPITHILGLEVGFLPLGVVMISN